MILLATLLACAPGKPGGGDPSPAGDDTGAGVASGADDTGGVGDSGEPASRGDADVEQLDAAPDPSDAVFDVTVIHTLDLVMDDADWRAVRDDPWSETWVPADLTVTLGGDGAVEEIPGIGLRAFGAGSMIAGKPALKLSLDHYASGASWRGLEQLKLDNSSQDAGFLNERIGTWVLRELDLPASRTGWARLRVNGEPAGFYVLLEPIDDRFVARWFGDDDGPLYGMISGRWGQGLKPLSDPLTYYEVQTSVDGDGSELVEAARLVAEGSDAELAAAVDLDNFTRISVARSVIGGIDTFSADGNNFYLYIDDGVVRQIPWDLDADLGYPWAFALALAVDPEAPWLTSPWAYNPLTGAAYTDPVLVRHLAMGADVGAILDELLAGPLDFSTVDAAVVASADLIRDDVYADVLGVGTGFDVRVANLRLFLNTRLSALAGGDVADCSDPGDGSVTLGSLSPTGTVGWGSLLVDQTDWGPGFTVNGEHYCTGLFAHAPSRVTVTLPAGVTALTGAVGLQDWNQTCGDGATFEIKPDGAVRWESGVLENYDAAVDFGTLAVAPGELVLTASPNAEYSCDTAAWLDVRVR